MAADELLELHFPVQGGDFTQAGEASSKIKRTLQQIGIAPALIRRSAIAAYEAEMNIVIHAYQGVLQLTIWPGYIELVASDSGPGIADLELAMQEGYSTAPGIAREMGFGAGMGLPNMQRNADELEVQSQVGVGTTVRIRISL